jgi:hypothetical protein
MNEETKRIYLFALECGAFELENARQLAKERGRHQIADNIDDRILDLDALAHEIKDGRIGEVHQ